MGGISPSVNTENPLWSLASVDLHIHLIDRQGNDILVTELAVTEQDLTANNLTIEDIHTYYAGNHPTLVHNYPTCGADKSVLKKFPDVSGMRGVDPESVLDVVPDHWEVMTPSK